MALNSRQTRFLFKFSGLLILFYVVVSPAPVDRAVIAPLTRGLSAVSASVINLLGQDATRSGTVIQNSRFAVDIKNGCNGIEAVVFLCAAIFAFDASIRARLAGVLAGVLAIQILNVVRIVTLFLLGIYRRDLFEVFHLAIWQSLIFGAAVFIFLYWTSKVQKLNAATTS